jgi:hypothetical protein
MKSPSYSLIVILLSMSIVACTNTGITTTETGSTTSTPAPKESPVKSGGSNSGDTPTPIQSGDTNPTPAPKESPANNPPAPRDTDATPAPKESPVTSRGNKWTAEQREPFLTSCISSATSSSDGVITEIQAQSYCNCTLEVLESRYSYQELEKKGLSVVKELENDGTVKSCLQKAGVPVP